MAIYYDSKPVEVDTTYDPTSENAVSGIAVKEAIDEAVQSMYKPGGSISFSNLPVLSADVLGFVYNITDAFTTDARFVEGAGTECAAGTNVVIVNTGTSENPVYKFDIFASGATQVQSDWAQTDASAVDYIKNKPTIPTVNDATLTISQNGALKGTFSANSSTNVAINLDGGSSTAEEIVNVNEATGATSPLKVWQGTEQEWTNGKGTDWYNWRTPKAIQSRNFTVVGSPTINETDYTITNFSTSNYITFPAFNTQTANTWEFCTKYVYYDSGTNVPQILLYSSDYRIQIRTNAGIRVGPVLQLFLSDDGNNFTIADDVKGITNLQNGRPYWIKLTFNGSQYILESSTNGTVWTTEVVVNSSNKVYYNSTPFRLGSNGSNMYLRGGTYFPVYLEDTYIKVNGEFFWTPYTFDQSSVYTLEAEPTTASTVYSEPNTTSALTITSIGTGTIALSDNNTYTYTQSGDVTTYQTIGDAYPNYLANINGVGVKIGNTLIADNTDTSTLQTTSNLVTSVSSSSTDSQYPSAKLLYDTVGNIEATLDAIIAQGSNS